MSVSTCLYVCLCLSLSVSVSTLSMSLSLAMCLSIYLSLSVCLAFLFSLCIRLSLFSFLLFVNVHLLHSSSSSILLFPGAITHNRTDTACIYESMYMSLYCLCIYLHIYSVVKSID